MPDSVLLFNGPKKKKPKKKNRKNKNKTDVRFQHSTDSEVRRHRMHWKNAFAMFLFSTSACDSVCSSSPSPGAKRSVTQARARHLHVHIPCLQLQVNFLPTATTAAAAASSRALVAPYYPGQLPSCKAKQVWTESATEAVVAPRGIYIGITQRVFFGFHTKFIQQQSEENLLANSSSSESLGLFSAASSAGVFFRRPTRPSASGSATISFFFRPYCQREWTGCQHSISILNPSLTSK